ncbi:unnamed protein product [Cylicocyclus nassatus]|uniref:Uncharacterized protein n=1 Tax=Cylicocyclus nassatus TaxID=53992 RepID=A0AA36DNB7_CYLNA|nr:unnamed protein product [Cylicocyclus nassatus]
MGKRFLQEDYGTTLVTATVCDKNYNLRDVADVADGEKTAIEETHAQTDDYCMPDPNHWGMDPNGFSCIFHLGGIEGEQKRLELMNNIPFGCCCNNNPNLSDLSLCLFHPSDAGLA